jgi:hypothetical protein
MAFVRLARYLRKCYPAARCLAMPSGIGKYEIVGKLGRGAMGQVFRGNDPVLGREVAIKRTTWATSRRARPPPPAIAPGDAGPVRTLVDGLSPRNGGRVAAA